MGYSLNELSINLFFTRPRENVQVTSMMSQICIAMFLTTTLFWLSRHCSAYLVKTSAILDSFGGLSTRNTTSHYSRYDCNCTYGSFITPQDYFNYRHLRV